MSAAQVDQAALGVGILLPVLVRDRHMTESHSAVSVEQAIRYWHGAYGPDPIPGDDDFKAGWHSRDQHIRELQQALSDHALGTEGGGGLSEGHAHEGRCPLCIECGGYGTVGTDDLASIEHKPDCRVAYLLAEKESQ